MIDYWRCQILTNMNISRFNIVEITANKPLCIWRFITSQKGPKSWLQTRKNWCIYIVNVETIVSGKFKHNKLSPIIANDSTSNYQVANLAPKTMSVPPKIDPFEVGRYLHSKRLLHVETQRVPTSRDLSWTCGAHETT